MEVFDGTSLERRSLRSCFEGIGGWDVGAACGGPVWGGCFNRDPMDWPGKGWRIGATTDGPATQFEPGRA